MNNTAEVPSVTATKVLRNVFLGDTGYRLLTWDTNSPGYRARLGYAFYQPDVEEPLFVGEDFHVPTTKSIDADDTLCYLLWFLLLRVGDTDREYFSEYTPEQMAFAEGCDIERLTPWADGCGSFVDINEGI
jgi:hypothetical protein